uniref:Rab11 family-interacting protein 3 n=1 Tax=Pan paniscus TaxID=9597 RepID=A0A2R9CKX2_PANPA
APGLEGGPRDPGPSASPPRSGPRGQLASPDAPGPGPRSEAPLPELDPLFSWTEEPEECGPASCPESAPFRLQGSSSSHRARGEVDLFSPFPAPTAGELALEEGPGSPPQPSDLSQTHPLPSEPVGSQEDGPRLRAVFDALDGDGDGFVRIEDFIQFATVYGAEQVKDLTKYLDPSGLGVISFEDFYQGITAIRNGDPDGQCYGGVASAQDEEPLACPDEFDDFVTYEANEVTDSAYMGSESTYSECETFTDEDTSTLVHPELQPEGDADSAGGSAVPSECLDAMEEPDHGALLLLPGRPHPHGQSVITVIGGEEHFEDYGEGSEAELSPETLCNGQLGCSDPAFLTPRLQQLDEENSELRSCTPCLKANIERLEEEKQKLLDEIESLTLRLSEEQENKRRMGDRLSHERHQFQRDKEATQELIEDLRKQLEHLQLLKLEAEQRRGRSSSMGLQEYHSRARESELEQEVRRLKQDNRNLKEQNEELNGQIITLSIQGAKSLFSTAFSESLAAEISSVSRDELMEAIQKQEEINFRLQDYIDRIIVAIMETNPSILEVK